MGVLKFRHLNLGVIGIFLYVGGEVAIGSYLIKYFGELMGYNETIGGPFVSFYWGGAMVGRFIGAVSLTDRPTGQKLSFMGLVTILAVTAVYFWREDLTICLIVLGLVAGNCVAFLLGRSAPARTLLVFSLFVVGLLLLTIFSGAQVAMWSVLAIGLFNSIMFPTIFTLAIKDLGKYTSQGSSLLIMAIVGGAVMTPVMGIIIGAVGYQHAFIFPIVSYLFIAYYGWKGYEIKQHAHR